MNEIVRMVTQRTGIPEDKAGKRFRSCSSIFVPDSRVRLRRKSTATSRAENSRIKETLAA
jgi:hypothetical protein